MRLFGRVYDEENPETYPWVPVDFDSKGRPAAVKDAVSYIIRGTWFDPKQQKNRRQVVPAGKTLEEAIVTLNRLRAVVDGTVTVAATQTQNGHRKHLTTLVSEFKAERVTLGAAHNTIIAYGGPLQKFLEYYQRPHVDQITRTDIIGFIQFLRDNLEARESSHENERNLTIKNYLTRVRAFLKWANGEKWDFPLAEKEWPKVTKKLPKKYSLRLVTKMLEKASDDEKDLILFHLYTGFRKGEVMHSKYCDVNFAKGSVNVSDKPEYGWKIKDREHRPKGIKLPKDFIVRLRNRQERHKITSDDALIFLNSKGRPDYDLLNQIREIAERSGIKKQLLKEMDLKKFRRTFATEYSKEFGIEETRQLLGHSNIKTTQAYLAAEEIDVDGNESESEARVERIWETVGD